MSAKWSAAEEHQLQLALVEDLQLKRVRRPRNGDHPMRAMVEFALERGVANGVGGLLDQVAAVRGHRMFNSLLIVLQRPHASYLLSANEWRDSWRRDIAPHESPIVIMWPFSPVQFVYEVGQTEPQADAPPLPREWENPYAMTDARNAGYSLYWLTENAKNDGVFVAGAGRGLRSAGCIRTSIGDRSQVVQSKDVRQGERRVSIRWDVMVNNAYSQTEQLCTLAHELGHLFCGHLGAAKEDWWPSRDVPDLAVREFEAESVARLVFRRLAPEAHLPPHLRQYFMDGAPAPTDGWQDVANAADRVLDMCLGISSERGSQPVFAVAPPATALE